MKTQTPYVQFGIKLNYIKIFKLFYLFAIAFVSGIPSYAQDVLVGSTTSFYQSLNFSSGKAKLANASQNIQVSVNESLPISFHSHSTVSNTDQFVGKIHSKKKSYVHFSFKNGQVDGKIIIPDEKKCYKYYSKSNNVYVTSEDLNKAMCIDYPSNTANAGTATTSTAPPQGSYAYTLESLPGATAVVMLDFDGHTTPSNSWWGSIVAQPSSMTEGDIVEAWNIMSEDFRPYQLNITTNEAVYQNAPTNQRMRCIFTPTTDAAPGYGGVAFIGSFTAGGDIAPCWVFNYGGKYAGETGSHEVGHTVGLFHDGRELPSGHEEYYGGQGDWAPIMGVSYYVPIGQWSKGEYQYANNSQDDINVIGTQNGFGFRNDAQGNSISTAAPLAVASDGTIDSLQNYGIISDQPDIDYFSFTTTGGVSTFTVTPAHVYPDLDMIVSIINNSGSTIVSGNPPEISSVTLTANLPAGTYYLVVDAIGYLDPFTTGYSDYSCIGEYRISGSLNTTTGSGISGPSCVTPNVPYVFTVTPDHTTGYNFVWWVTGEVNLQQDPTDPKKATISFLPTTNQTLVVNVGINYNTDPWYQAYQKTVQIGNCTTRQSLGLNSDDDQQTIKHITILDVNGREILKGDSYEPDTFIKDQTLPSGLYLMHVEDESDSYVVRIAK